MWTTLLVVAAVVSLEPVRIALTIFMLNRPRPFAQLLAFLCGGFVMGFGVGLLVLIILWDTLLAGVNFSVSQVQIGIGLVAVVISVMVATNVSLRKLIRRPKAGAPVGANPGSIATEQAEPNSLRGLQKLSDPARRLLRSGSLWVAWVSGLGIALPSGDYTAALAVIAAGRPALAVQAGALLVFNVLAFALVEIPLLSYLLTPNKTRAAIAALGDWVQSRPRRHVAALLALAGCVMIAQGIIGL
jgi:Sap, sulfolipid-1-addressing protein